SAPKALRAEAARQAPRRPGAYLLSRAGEGAIYVGQSASLRSRLLTHCKPLQHEAGFFSTALLPEGSSTDQLLEVENDIIAALLVQPARVPRLQFGAMPSSSAVP